MGFIGHKCIGLVTARKSFNEIKKACSGTRSGGEFQDCGKAHMTQQLKKDYGGSESKTA
jgi:hypothetical protein